MNAPDWTLLERLLATPGPAGREDAVAAVLEDACDAIVRAGDGDDHVLADAIGNRWVTLGRSGIHILFCAHMDEVGLTTTGIDADGAVRFAPLGGVALTNLWGCQVVVHAATDVPGVIGTLPPQLGAAADDAALCIDVGASSADEARALGVATNQVVSLWRDVAPIRSPRAWIGKGLDDRIGCFLLAHLLRRAVTRRAAAGRRLTFLWTTQDEVGHRGAIAAARRLRPDVVVQWDAVADDGRRVGRGPVLRARDDGSASDPALLAWIAARAADAGMPLVPQACGGQSEAKPFQDLGARTASINVPVVNLHRESEMVSRSDLERLVRLGEALLDAITAGGLDAFEGGSSR